VDRVTAGSAFLQPRLCRLMSPGHSVNSYEKSFDPAEESLRNVNSGVLGLAPGLFVMHRPVTCRCDQRRRRGRPIRSRNRLRI